MLVAMVEATGAPGVTYVPLEASNHRRATHTIPM